MAEINEIAPLVPSPGLRRQDPRRQPLPQQEDKDRERDERNRRPPRDGNARIDEYV